MNWDMASLLNFTGVVGSGQETDLHALLVSKLVKHKEQTFQVISLIGTDEVQQTINSSGRLTVLKKNDAFQKKLWVRSDKHERKKLVCDFLSRRLPIMCRPYMTT